MILEDAVGTVAGEITDSLNLQPSPPPTQFQQSEMQYNPAPALSDLGRVQAAYAEDPARAQAFFNPQPMDVGQLQARAFQYPDLNQMQQIAAQQPGIIQQAAAQGGWQTPATPNALAGPQMGPPIAGQQLSAPVPSTYQSPFGTDRYENDPLLGMVNRIANIPGQVSQAVTAPVVNPLTSPLISLLPKGLQAPATTARAMAEQAPGYLAAAAIPGGQAAITTAMMKQAADAASAYANGDLTGKQALTQIVVSAGPLAFPMLLKLGTAGAKALAEFSQTEVGQGILARAGTFATSEAGGGKIPGEKPPVGPEGNPPELPASAEGANLPAPPESALPTTTFDQAALQVTELMRKAQRLRPEQEAMFAAQRKAQMGAAEQAFQSGQGVAGAKQAAAGAFDRPTFQPLDLPPQTEQLIRNEIDTTSKIQTGDRFAANAALDALKNGVLPQPKQFDKLATVLGPDFTQAALDKIPATLAQNFVDALNLPRTLIASMDLSAPFRQGILLSVGHPKEFGASFVAQIKAALSDEGAAAIDQAMRDKPTYQMAIDAGLDHVKEFGTANVMKEESFMSKLAEQLPVVGPLVRASERAYVTFLNKLRFDTFDTIVNNWQQGGIPVNDSNLHNLALYLNNATGRGSLGAARAYGPTLNAAFFSPRFALSRFQLAGDLLRPTQSAVVRQQAMRDLGAFVATGMGIMGLAKAAGANVQLDPRSAMFGKVNGVDFWGGYQQIARYAVQAITQSQVVSGSQGDVTMPRDFTKVFSNYLRSKLAPIPGLAISLHTGRDFAGNPVTPSSFLSLSWNNPAVQMVAPLAWSDLVNSITASGPKGAATGILSTFGFGVTPQTQNPALMQRADAFQAKQAVAAAGMPTPDSGNWKNYLKPLGPTGSTDTYDKFRQGYLNYFTQQFQAKGMSLGEAKAKASTQWSNEPLVKKYNADLNQAQLRFWQQHPDLLNQQVNAGYKPSKEEQAILNRYRATHPQ